MNLNGPNSDPNEPDNCDGECARALCVIGFVAILVLMATIVFGHAP